MDKDHRPAVDRNRILNRCHELILKWSRIHFRRFIKQSETQLYSMAEKAETADDRAHFYQVRDEIRFTHAGVEETFLRHVHKHFLDYQEQRTTPGHITGALNERLLNLIGKDNRELFLALQTMARKSNVRTSELMYVLNLRLAALASCGKLNEHNSPIASGVFAEGLQSSLVKLSVDHRSLLVIYKVYDSVFMALLPKLYAMLNNYCQTQGILPNLPIEPSDGESASSHNSGPAEVGTHSDAPQSAPTMDPNTIDRVGKLFEAILHADDLPDTLKATVSYLQTPFMKIAMRDVERFEQPNHPARQLLDLFADAGHGWREELTENSPILQEMRQIVQQVVADNSSDLRLLTDLRTSFSQYLKHLRREQAAEEKRQKLSKSGQNALDQAREKIDELLYKRLVETPLSPDVTALMLQAGADHLIYIQMRYGANSAQWQQTFSDLDALLTTLKRNEDSNLFDTLLSLDFPLATALIKSLPGGEERLQKTNDIAKVDTSFAAPRINPELLTPDTWLLMNADQPKKAQQNLKISAVNNTGDTLTLSNSNGFEVAIREKTDIVQEIAKGKIRILTKLDDKAFFAQSKDRLFQQLANRGYSSADDAAS